MHVNTKEHNTYIRTYILIHAYTHTHTYMHIHAYTKNQRQKQKNQTLKQNSCLLLKILVSWP